MAVDEAAPKPPGRVARLKTRAQTAKTDGTDLLERTRRRLPIVDLGSAMFQHDVAIGGGLMSAALAFRLFLFQVPLALLTVGLLSVWSSISPGGPIGLGDDLGASGALTDSVSHALSDAQHAMWFAIAVGLFGVIYAGRNLVRSLVQIRARAWGLSGATKVRPALQAAAGGSILLVVTLMGIHARLRDRLGLLATPLLFASTLVTYSAAFVLIAWFLPRATKRW